MEPTPKLKSVDGCLEGKLRPEARREYAGGQAYVMTGSSLRRNRIAGNIHAHFWQFAQNPPGRVHQEAVKLRVGREDTAAASYYPDVMVVCGKGPPGEHYKTEPCILVEVLPPYTASVDLREKYLEYTCLPSFRTHLVVQPGRPVCAALVSRRGGVPEPPRPYCGRQHFAALPGWADHAAPNLSRGV